MDAANLADQLDIRQLLARYCHLVDDGELDRLVELFTVDATFTWGELSATGTDELSAWFARHHPPERRGKHLTTNTVVELDGDQARSWSDFVFLGFKEGRLFPVYTGRYHDRFERMAGEWRLARRDAVQLHPPAR